MCGSPQNLPRGPSCDEGGHRAQGPQAAAPSWLVFATFSIPFHTSSLLYHFQPLKHSTSGTLALPPQRQGPDGDTSSTT